MTETAAPICSFCGQPASEAGFLVQGPQAAICEDCCRTALELVHDRRSGALSQDGRVRITDYPVDVPLARAIGESRLLRFPFIPLLVQKERVVVALTDVGHMGEIQALLAQVESQLTGTPRSLGGIDAILAEETAILGKIRDALQTQE